MQYTLYIMVILIVYNSTIQDKITLKSIYTLEEETLRNDNDILFSYYFGSDKRLLEIILFILKKVT